MRSASCSLNDVSEATAPEMAVAKAFIPFVVCFRRTSNSAAATPLRARATEAALIGRPWTERTVREAAAVMAAEGTPMDDHRASASYRSAMLGQSLLRFYFADEGASA